MEGYIYFDGVVKSACGGWGQSGERGARHHFDGGGGEGSK